MDDGEEGQEKGNVDIQQPTIEISDTTYEGKKREEIPIAHFLLPSCAFGMIFSSSSFSLGFNFQVSVTTAPHVWPRVCV